MTNQNINMEPQANHTRPIRPFQFSVATLLILTTALSVWLATNRGATAGQVSLALLYLAPKVLGQWKIFEKAGLPPWGAVIPIYNLILLIRVAQKPAWWLLLYIIPLINLFPVVLVPLGVARNFGKTGLFAAGLIFLGSIFYPILGFGVSEYHTPTYVRFHSGEPYIC